VLDKATMTQFRAAICERIAQPSGSRAPLNAVIAAMAAEARREEMAVEQLVILIKREWEDMTDDGLIAHGNEHSPLRDSIVTSAIKAYYVQ
jgi:hypothetical protein